MKWITEIFQKLFIFLKKLVDLLSFLANTRVDIIGRGEPGEGKVLIWNLNDFLFFFLFFRMKDIKLLERSEDEKIVRICKKRKKQWELYFFSIARWARGSFGLNKPDFKKLPSKKIVKIDQAYNCFHLQIFTKT